MSGTRGVSLPAKLPTLNMKAGVLECDFKLLGKQKHLWG